MNPLATPNLLLNTDSYKASHWQQYPAGSEQMFSYIEARSSKNGYQHSLFFGLQALVQQVLSQPITDAMIVEARELLTAHGEPFNEAGWRRILTEFGGYLPLTIRAVPEGRVVPLKQVLVTVESTDPESFWLASYIETWLLRVWYPTTVATLSWHIKQQLRQYLTLSSDDPETSLAFKLHDFGARGTSSNESAGLGGCAHLVNFLGTDTLQALLIARQYYDEPMAGFSIPAAEHSSLTSWGRDQELDAYRNMIRLFGQPGKIFACVSDSYNLWNALKLWGTDLKDELIASGATLVVRPDSGDPVEIVARTVQELDGYFGSTLNSKGYKLLNQVRIIQGDGIDASTVAPLYERLLGLGFSADNLALGMGGGLLQQVNRDTLGFAMKCSALKVQGQWRDVYKDPITDPGKTSKKGRLSLFRHQTTGDYQSLRIDDAGLPEISQPELWQDQLQTLYHNGQILRRQSLSEIRALSNQPG